LGPGKTQGTSRGGGLSASGLLGLLKSAPHLHVCGARDLTCGRKLRQAESVILSASAGNALLANALQTLVLRK
jgi:hypothetical protein